jgi:Protein of unknown function (DUF3303)
VIIDSLHWSIRYLTTLAAPVAEALGDNLIGTHLHGSAGTSDSGGQPARNGGRIGEVSPIGGDRREGGVTMAKYVMSWKTRGGGSAQENHDDGKSILAAFAKWQIPADQNYTEFLSRIDGGGGFAVIETDNQAGLLDGVSKFITWLEFDIVPVLDIMDGVAVLAAGAEFRESA